MSNGEREKDEFEVWCLRFEVKFETWNQEFNIKVFTLGIGHWALDPHPRVKNYCFFSLIVVSGYYSI